MHIYIWITILHLFACLSTLELPTLEQHKYFCAQQKYYHWVQTLSSDKCTIIGNKQLQKERGHCEDCTSSKKAV